MDYKMKQHPDVKFYSYIYDKIKENKWLWAHMIPSAARVCPDFTMDVQINDEHIYAYCGCERLGISVRNYKTILPKYTGSLAIAEIMMHELVHFDQSLRGDLNFRTSKWKGVSALIVAEEVAAKFGKRAFLTFYGTFNVVDPHTGKSDASCDEVYKFLPWEEEANRISAEVTLLFKNFGILDGVVDPALLPRTTLSSDSSYEIFSAAD